MDGLLQRWCGKTYYTDVGSIKLKMQTLVTDEEQLAKGQYIIDIETN
jgi:hypothetical protein